MSSQLWKSSNQGALPPFEERPRTTDHCPTTAKYHNFLWKCGIMLVMDKPSPIKYCWQIWEQSAGGLTYIYEGSKIQNSEQERRFCNILQHALAKKSCCCWWTGHHSLWRGFEGDGGGVEYLGRRLACMRMCLCDGFRVVLCFLQRRNLSVVTKRVWSQVVSSC